MTRKLFCRGGFSAVGYYLLPCLRPLSVTATRRVSPRGSASACIFIFLQGGPSQLDTFDVKEGSWTPPDFDIRTDTEGIRMPHGLFPRLSQRLRDLVLVRSLEAWENEHARAQYYAQVGHLFSPARAEETPSIGSIVAREYSTRRKPSDRLPPFVAMNFRTANAGLIGAGMLPVICQPFPVDTEKELNLVLPEERKSVLARRREYARQLDAALGRTAIYGKAAEEFRTFYDDAYGLLSSPAVASIFQVSEAEHRRYGSSSFGSACVVARNLVRADQGTHFISISHGAGAGWDLHGKIYDKSEKSNHYTLCAELDSGLSSLLEDLSGARQADGRTLLDKTLIVCMGEFGRTPGKLNENKGRDHHRFASMALFAGGGVRGGRAIGATDEEGARVIRTGWDRNRSIYIEDAAATMYSALGIDWSKRIANTPSGRAFEYLESSSGPNAIAPGEIALLFEDK